MMFRRRRPCPPYGYMQSVGPPETFEHLEELIEQSRRNHEEILSALGTNRPQKAFPVFNPAFDVTPGKLITALICEKGVIQPPNLETISRVLDG